MQEQNFKNNSKYSPLYHIVLLGIIIAIVVLSIKNLIDGINISSILFLLIAIAFVIGFVVFRQFPLAA